MDDVEVSVRETDTNVDDFESRIDFSVIDKFGEKLNFV